MEKFSYLNLICILGLLSQTHAMAASAEGNPAKPEEDIASEKVPCTLGTPQLGLRACKDVSRDGQLAIKKGISHIIGYYYDGKILSFHEPVSKNEVSRGFCIEKELPKEATVCSPDDIKSAKPEENWKGEKCGDKFPSSVTASNIPGAKGYCQISVDGGVKVETCAKEKDWFERGGMVQAWQHHLEEVSDEIEKGEIGLVNYAKEGDDPVRPCAGFARQIHRVLGLNGEKESVLAVEERIRRDFPEAELATALSESCLKEGTDARYVKAKKGSFLDRALASVGLVEISPNTEAQPAEGVASKGLASANGFNVFEKPVIKNDDVEFSEEAFQNRNGLVRQNKALSQAACHLAFARKHVETLFFKLAACEVVYRAKKSYYSYFQSFFQALGPLSEAVISPCVSYAKGEEDPENFMKNFYKCYKGEVAGKSSIKSFIPEYMKSIKLTTRSIASHEKIGEDPDLKPCGEQSFKPAQLPVQGN